MSKPPFSYAGVNQGHDISEKTHTVLREHNMLLERNWFLDGAGTPLIMARVHSGDGSMYIDQMFSAQELTWAANFADMLEAAVVIMVRKLAKALKERRDATFAGPRI